MHDIVILKQALEEYNNNLKAAQEECTTNDGDMMWFSLFQQEADAGRNLAKALGEWIEPVAEKPALVYLVFLPLDQSFMLVGLFGDKTYSKTPVASPEILDHLRESGVMVASFSDHLNIIHRLELRQ